MVLGKLQLRSAPPESRLKIGRQKQHLPCRLGGHAHWHGNGALTVDGERSRLKTDRVSIDVSELQSHSELVPAACSQRSPHHAGEWIALNADGEIVALLPCVQIAVARYEVSRAIRSLASDSGDRQKQCRPPRRPTHGAHSY